MMVADLSRKFKESVDGPHQERMSAATALRGPMAG
jgi:hypothetical protein